MFSIIVGLARLNQFARYSLSIYVYFYLFIYLYLYLHLSFYIHTYVQIHIYLSIYPFIYYMYSTTKCPVYRPVGQCKLQQLTGQALWDTMCTNVSTNIALEGNICNSILCGYPVCSLTRAPPLAFSLGWDPNLRTETALHLDNIPEYLLQVYWKI